MERKKVEPLAIVKTEPKKRDVPLVIEKDFIELTKSTSEPDKKLRVKASADKYLHFTFDELKNPDTIKTINNKVQNGEVKFAYFTTDNDIGYHYYLCLRN